MMAQICLVVEFTIADGKVETFKKLFLEAIEITKRKDSGTLSYQLYFNDDETKCYSIEWYENSEAILGHLDSMADISVPLFEICRTTRFEIFGNPSKKLSEVFEASSPNIYQPWVGFSR
jgi:quinol monooxygenase YgiN